MAAADNGRAEFLIDLDAFAPSAGKRFQFLGKQYMARYFNDLKIDDAMRILRVQDEIRGKSPIEQLEISIQHLAIMVPSMDRAIVGTLTIKQMLELMGLAMGAGEVPPVADAAPSGSGTASPLSAASTDGPGPQSGS